MSLIVAGFGYAERKISSSTPPLLASKLLSLLAMPTNTLPPDIYNAIEHKLKSCTSKNLLLMIDAELATTLKMEAGISSQIHNNETRALLEIPTHAYKQLAIKIQAFTASWPKNVWKCITPVLDDIPIEHLRSSELSALIGDALWDAGDEPPSLDQIDADTFLEMISQIANHHTSRTTYKKQLEGAVRIEETLARIRIIEAANNARDSLDASINDYLKSRNGATEQRSATPTETNNKNTNTNKINTFSKSGDFWAPSRIVWVIKHHAATP
jgi:hypothetical protein